ncbi:MAG: manganese efflux pump [Tissierellaceae bacterium]|nr:manganese efflux pump [Tissierellaceae bacterium]
MELISLILMATAVSIDGFWGGFSFGLRNIRIKPFSLFVISFMSVICTMIAMLIGYNISEYIPIEIAKFIGAGLLILLGILTVKGNKKQDKNLNENLNLTNVKLKDLIKVLRNPILADIDNQNDIKPVEGTILGLAVAMDASIAAFTIALMGVNPYTTPFLFGLTHFILIGIGNIAAMNSIVNKIGQKFHYLPGLILMVLGLLRLV